MSSGVTSNLLNQPTKVELGGVDDARGAGQSSTPSHDTVQAATNGTAAGGGPGSGWTDQGTEAGVGGSSAITKHKPSSPHEAANTRKKGISVRIQALGSENQSRSKLAVYCTHSLCLTTVPRNSQRWVTAGALTKLVRPTS